MVYFYDGHRILKHMNIEKPFISICIPAFKRVASLRRLLQSVAGQSYKNYEVIISDDSPDQSVRALVEDMAPFLTVYYSKNNPAAGTPANWNLALQKAQGGWIKLMHDDDWFASPHALQKFADAACSNAADFIFSACNNIYASGREVNEFLAGWKKDMLEENFLNLLYSNVIGHPSTVMHRRDNSILYDTRFKWVVDIDFYIRYLQKHNGYAYIPEMLVNIGTGDTQVSHDLYKNPKVEVPEYLALLAKFPPGILMEHEYVFHSVWNLVKRFRIRNAMMIEDLGYQGQVPDHLQEIMDYQRPYPYLIIKQSNWSRFLMKRCFKKIKAQGLKR
jgi:glycosyltransferase involved in cell wall biosynthesis